MTGKLIWFHVPSAGEFLQAQPLLELFLNNDYDCVVTYNSVSAEKWIHKSKINAKKEPLFLDYIPFDTKRSIRRWIQTVKPSVLVFVKFDLWPNLIWQTSKANIPIYLISATLHAKTKRYSSAIGRSLYGDLYSRFKLILTVTEDDKRRFLETNAGLNVEAFGDTRFDSVISRRDKQIPPDFPAYVQKKRVFIVGSCWPPDEKCIFPVLKEALAKYPDLMLIIAPHEPTSEHLKDSEDFFKDEKLVRLSALNANSKVEFNVVLVDSVGVLSSIYKVGDFAYVGGGFTTGVHNVMEPCAFGLPVFFGPFHYNSPEALQLVSDQLAFPVNNSEDFKPGLERLLSNPDKARQLGQKARQFIESQAGASEKCFQIISREINEN
ncbi:3-deoxy-D-manno-octulosonic acid transferase [bacterium]|nr:3-deoxy-D-manno-octulosonic acid transferase [bacterium]